MYETRQKTIPFPSRLNGYYCDGKKGSYGTQFSKAYSKASYIDESIPQKTIKYPKGIAENVLVGIGKFVFPVDFIILDMPEDIKVPLILGRPFLSTAHAKIDVFKRKITLRVGEERIVFTSVKPASSLIKRVYMLRRNQVFVFFACDDLKPTIKKGEVIEEFRTRNNELDTKINDYPSYCDYDKKIHIDYAMYKGNNVVGALMNVPIFVGTFSVVTDFAVLENVDAYRDERMGDAIFGKPFLRKVEIKAKRFEGMITIYNGDNEVTYQMVDSNPRSARIPQAPDRYGFYVDVEEYELGDFDEPPNYKAALADPESDKWLEAMNTKMQSMKDNQVWVLVELPPNGRTVGSKWLFKKKTDMDGNVHTFKARIRAVRILLAITTFYDYEIWQMDVKTAFLNGHLSEDVYMVQPEGFVDPNHPNKVCKLQHSIYGLKQASKSWNKRFDVEIKKIGFTQNPDEPGVYLKASGSSVAFLILYVDDILLMGNNVTMLQEVKSWLSKCFSMKDLGEAAYILGNKIIRDRSKRLISLSQSAYLEKILKKFRMENSKKGYTPIMKKPDYRKSQGAKTPSEIQRMQRVPYDSAIGSIMYAVRCTRLDVAIAENLCSRFQQNFVPKLHHHEKLECKDSNAHQIVQASNSPEKDMLKSVNIKVGEFIEFYDEVVRRLLWWCGDDDDDVMMRVAAAAETGGGGERRVEESDVGDRVDRKSCLGRVVFDNFADLNYVRSLFNFVEFGCLLEINDQICPRFILEFYSQYQINYSDKGQMFIEFVIQNHFFSYPLEEFAQILDIPCEGPCVFTDKWSLDELAYGVPTDGPFQTNPPSPDDIISSIRIDREGQVRRIRHEEEINVLECQIFTREIVPTLKPLEEIIRENVFCLGGNQDHVP
ncbi:retrotransposon protein, putative, ty1-copia subclass, partial [Tanacetum coccineum]